MEWFRRARGIEFLNVPYKSASLTMPAMLGGEIDMAYLAIGLAAQNVKAGKAKALAVVGPSTRSPILPDVPTWREAGMEMNIATWFGLYAPAGTPRDVINRVNGELVKGLFNDAAAREKFLRIMREQTQRMARLVDDLLSLSRIEQHMHVNPATPVDLTLLVAHIVDTLAPTVSSVVATGTASGKSLCYLLPLLELLQADANNVLGLALTGVGQRCA